MNDVSRFYDMIIEYSEMFRFCDHVIIHSKTESTWFLPVMVCVFVDTKINSTLRRSLDLFS